MSSDEMSLILEMICSGCSVGDCKFHQNKTFATDKVTGLEVEARCVCKNCRTED